MRAGPRKAAMLAGVKHYFTGEPCHLGHVAERIVSSKACVECAALKRAERADLNKAYQKMLYWKTHTPKTDFPSLDPAYHSVYSKKHYIENKPLYRARDRKRRAIMAGLTEHHTQEDVNRIFFLQKGKCACCRTSIAKAYDIDHIQPIVRGGSDAASNIQLLCGPCNKRKSARDPIDFMRSVGKLL